MAIKLNKAKSMLSKSRAVLDKQLWSQSVKQHLNPNYAVSLVWASVKRLHLLQKKFLRIIFFQSRIFHTSPLFKDPGILNSFDKMALKNWLIISKALKRLLPLPSIFGSNNI